VITGEIESLIIDDEAEGLVIDLGNGVKVLSAELNSKVSFKGTGTIKRVEVNADGVTFEKKPTKIIVAAGVKQPKIIIPPNSNDDSHQDNLKIAAAKIAIEGTSYTATQAEASDANAALTKAQALVNALGTELKETTATAKAVTFTAATAGNAATPTGTNGLYTFTVTINKGEGTQVTTSNLTMTITATPYDSTAQDNLDIAATKVAIEGATYTATQATVTDAMTALAKAQSLVDALGTQLKGTTATVATGTFTAATAGDASTPTGTNGSYIFNVTIAKGLGTQATTSNLTMTITATLYDSTAQDILDIAAAKTAIVGAVYTSTQAEASDATAAMTKAQSLVDALGTQLKGTTATVSSGSLIPATEGNVFMPTGVNGTYMFTVTVSKGTETQVINVLLAMTITATPYIPVIGVTLDITTIPDLEVGTGATKTSQQLTATVSPANAVDKSVVWDSSNDTVATVNSNGIVTAVGAGTANIKVTTIEGNFEATCSVTVTDMTPAPTQYTLTLTGTKISSTPAAGLIDENTSVTVTVSLAAGQTIESFTVDGVEKKTDLAANTYTFTMTKDTTISSTVKLAQVEILAWTDNVINWVNLEDEEKYIVTIYKDSSTLSSNQVSANSTFYDCSTLITSNGSGMYSASVKAINTIANGFIDGGFSAMSTPKLVNNATFTGAVWDNSKFLLTINLQNVHSSSVFDLTKLSYSDGISGTYALSGAYNRVFSQPEVEGDYGRFFIDGTNKLIINLTEADFNVISSLPDNALFSGTNSMSDTISADTGWNSYNSINAGEVNSQNVSVK
jgi:hypothetical protein